MNIRTKFEDLFFDEGFHITNGRMWKVKYVKKCKFVPMSEDLREKINAVYSSFKGVKRTVELLKIFNEEKHRIKNKKLENQWQTKKKINPSMTY